MRWESLFDDLEGQFLQAARDEAQAELADLTRAERSQVGWAERLRAQPGSVALTLRAGAARGRPVEVGPDWVLLREEPAGRRASTVVDAQVGDDTVPRRGSGDVLVPLAAVVTLRGIGPGAVELQGRVARALGLTSVLRGLVRDRVELRLDLLDGAVLVGTALSVGADHLDVRRHEPGEWARRGEVWTIPLASVVAVRLR